ncbi:peroxidase family protein [Hymenobacter sp. HD11105]
MTAHGELYLRDHIPPRSIYYEHGRFGRLFPSLQPCASNTPEVRANLLELGRAGGLMDPGDPMPATGGGPLDPSPNNRDHLTMPPGFTFLGQFLDHDMTFDPTSSLERQNDPEAVANFRTPFLELDSLYGAGPAANPHFYDARTRNIKFLIESLDPGNPAAHADLPRNSQLTALIADPRNDENVIISQLHLALLRFHNALADELNVLAQPDAGAAFRRVQQLVRWHYQWLIVHEYLPTICGQQTVQDILARGRKFYTWRNLPFIPVEFSVAAFRFGHTQIRPGYRLNQDGDGGNPFEAFIFRADIAHSDPDPADLRGGKRAPRRFVDWRIFFEGLGPGTKRNKQLDTQLSSPMFQLPTSSPGPGEPPPSLAQRNLLRGLTFGLPSGQNVAALMAPVIGSDPLTPGELAELQPLGMARQTPLWYYILKEAEVRAGGNRLGPVGARIVAEVMLGLLEGDSMSYLAQNPTWVPTLAPGRDFKMADLLKFAGVAP